MPAALPVPPLRAATAIALLALSASPAVAQEIDEARCAANKAAGTITFLTSFGYAASPGILDVVAARELGYFEALCLDVEMQPGSTNTQLVSAGRAQIAGIGGASDTLVARDNGAEIIGIATYGNVGAIEIITMADSGIETLADFTGKIVGYKGAVAPQFSAMFLDNGVEPTGIEWVSVGYDPSILPGGQVQGLGAYKSNEPRVLEEQGHTIREWDPDAFGIHTTFNTQVANAQFAADHPTAVEDFLRASFHALDWIEAEDANLDTALDWAAALSPAGYDIPRSKRRFRKEMALITESQPEGTGIGWQSVAQWTPEAEMLQRFGLVTETPDIASAMTPAFVDAIRGDDGALIWP
ncbi:ABC transporter substrate-binding protein [Pseudooceanicola nanhaiensis]|uniref:ABC transporter substrate-binding protein n=1 Tax=Pseudooceanicola nanhaiensis TaxID=375761 RepID=UPI001CD4BDCE|nr:ABC transporter substrate-binding protein [Pseudooceanicola nanhaiensis]MCA0920769.1 ABC transporter substrate-binding protein [Pseudooceanicola nanhaiensis]